MAETFYFSHDLGARNDPKLINLQMELGHEGKGLFWDLIEILYEQDGYIFECDIKSISFALHADYERIKIVLTSYDLFKFGEGKYWSESVLRRLEIRYSKSEKARESVNKRWERQRNNTNVLPTQYEGNTIKESKVKESKGDKVKKDNANKFAPPTLIEVQEYFKEKGYKNADKAFDFYNEANWHDSKGNKVKNWKQKMLSVWFKDENKIGDKKNTYHSPLGGTLHLTEEEYNSHPNKKMFKLVSNA